MIDKVEINHNPGAEYRSDISAVVNVLTRKKAEAGFSGHIYGEVLLSKHEISSYPSAAIQYSSGKLPIRGISWKD